jgi:hypothetical protein
MLKPIPQEEPEKKRKRRTKSRRKTSKKAQGNRKQDTAQPRSPKASPAKKCVLTDTYKQLITYTSDPNKHTDREISDIILSMHRSILHLEQARLKKRNKRRGK